MVEPAGDPFATRAPVASLSSDALGADIPPEAPSPTPLTEAQAARADKVLAAARVHLDKDWRWGGRDQDSHPGVDCLGLMFLADGAVSGRSWRTFEVDPSQLVANGKLGAPVPGVDGVLRAQVPVANLMPGDALYFLVADDPIEDAPLMVRDDTSYWPWHTGLYLGDGQVIHADPGSVVRVQALDDLRFDALLATRLPDSAVPPQ